MVPDEAKAAVTPLFPQLMEMIWGAMVSQALHVAAKLAVFDVLRDGPKTSTEIAQATATQEPALRRLLRFLTSVDILIEDEGARFSATSRGEFLRSDHPESARSLAVMYGEPFFWRAWGDLYDTIKTGKPGFEHAHGIGFFEYLAQHADDAAIFNAGMTSASSFDVPGILNAYDFSVFNRIVDVAGGHGALLRGILETCPNVKGVLCDLPSVTAGASEIIQSGVANRCEVVGTNMFQSVPAGGDAYILKRILHDWSDAESARILRNCRRAITADGKLLVIEFVVKPPNQPDAAKMMDLNMLVLLTGLERTAEEFHELYASAGFRLTRIVPAMRLSIIEGVPA
jgi:O-methyltransferase domain/Dimerisation domain